MTTNSEKKKKHKKITEEDATPRLTIDTSTYHEGSDDNWIVNLPYGPAAKGDLSGVKFWLCKSKSQDLEKRKERIMFAEQDGLHYIAYAEKQRYAVGEVTDSNELPLKFARRYNFRVYSKDEREKEDASVELEETMSKYEQADRLTVAFGSSKARRRVQSRQKNVLDDNALEAAVKPALDDVVLPLKQDLDTLSSSDGVLMPVCHKDAELVEDVYRLSDLISESEMTALSNVCSEFSDSTREQVIAWRNENKYSRHILDRLEYLTHDETLRLHRARCLRYLQYLITLYQMKSKEIGRPHPLPFTIPEIIRQNLLDKFTMNATNSAGKTIRCMPKRLKDALVSHILVLSLVIDDLHSNCTSLKRDLQLTDNGLQAHVGALGARLKVEKKGMTSAEHFAYTIILQLPLAFKLERSLKRKRE